MKQRHYHAVLESCNKASLDARRALMDRYLDIYKGHEAYNDWLDFLAQEFNLPISSECHPPQEVNQKSSPAKTV